MMFGEKQEEEEMLGEEIMTEEKRHEEGQVNAWRCAEVLRHALKSNSNYNVCKGTAQAGEILLEEEQRGAEEVML